MTTFCAEHGISRKTFYEIRRRTVADGPRGGIGTEVAASEVEPV